MTPERLAALIRLRNEIVLHLIQVRG